MLRPNTKTAQCTKVKQILNDSLRYLILYPIKCSLQSLNYHKHNNLRDVSTYLYNMRETATVIIHDSICNLNGEINAYGTKSRKK